MRALPHLFRYSWGTLVINGSTSPDIRVSRASSMRVSVAFGRRLRESHRPEAEPMSSSP
jgi:hypothetical protein